MATCDYNCTELPEHELVACGQYPKGGTSAIGILECDHTIADFGDGTDLQAAIDTGKLTIIKNIKGELPDPSPVEGENVSGCGPENILDGFDRTATWSDFNVTAANVDFYNALNKRATFLILYHCESETLTVVESKTRYIAHRSSPASSKQKEKFSVTAKWSSFDEPAIYTAPAGIFE